MEELQAKMQQLLDQYKTLCATERDLLDIQRNTEQKIVEVRLDIARMQGALSVYQGLIQAGDASGEAIEAVDTGREIQKKTEASPRIAVE